MGGTGMNWSEDDYADYLKRQSNAIKLSNVLRKITTHDNTCFPSDFIDCDHPDEPKPKKPAKYRNNRPLVDGIRFDSDKEANYYLELRTRQKAGEILGFCRQPEFVLQEGFGDTKPIIYKADFIVFSADPFRQFDVVDVKGITTPVFELKYKMFKAKFPRLRLVLV